MPYEIELLWKTDDADEAARYASELADAPLAEIGAVLQAAVSGQRRAAYSYVRNWRLLARTLLRNLSEVRPDLVIQVENDYLLVDVKQQPSLIAQDLLVSTAMQAPFSPWVITMTPHLGAAVSLVSELRKYTLGYHPIPVPAEQNALPHWDIDRAAFQRFSHYVWMLMQEDLSPLERIGQTFELSDTELGHLFGVSRQAIGQWIEQGIPTARSAKVLAVVQILDALEGNLRPERIPGVVRQPAGVFKRKSILQLIEADKHLMARDLIRDSFEWAIPA